MSETTLTVLLPTLLLTAAASTRAAAPMDAPDLMPVKMQAAPTHAPVELVRDGKPVGVVYVARGGNALLGELSETIKLSTGAELPVVSTPPAAGFSCELRRLS